MKNHASIHAVLGAALLMSPIVACGGGGNTDEAGESTDSTGVKPGTESSGTSDDPTVTPEDTTMNVEPTTESPTTESPTTESPTTDPGTSSTTDPTTGEVDEFVFQEDPYDAYTQIDRHGAVEAGTAGIAAAQGLGFKPGSDISIRDDYNASSPAEDVMGMWVPEIQKSVEFFHDALDDDILMAGFVPATVKDSLDQAGPVIVPDTIKYDPTKPTAYPNGRKLTDQVVDITLAAVLLKLGALQPLSSLADIPLNPPKNDVDFLPEFPFLAPPHK